MKLTEDQVRQQFEIEELEPVLQQYPNDKPALRQAFVEYVDALHRANLLSDTVANGIDNPY